jgi:hypothetical protein
MALHPVAQERRNIRPRLTSDLALALQASGRPSVGSSLCASLDTMAD